MSYALIAFQFCMTPVALCFFFPHLEAQLYQTVYSDNKNVWLVHTLLLLCFVHSTKDIALPHGTYGYAG